MDWQKCFCILTLTRCTLAIHETVGVLTNNKNSMEVGAASAEGRETKSLGLY